MSRPFKLTEEKKRRLLRRVMDGATVERAARSVGCCLRTVRRAALREPGFAWRLQTARDTRCELRRRENEPPLSAEDCLAGLSDLYRELEEELRQRWLAEDLADITATPPEATT